MRGKSYPEMIDVIKVKKKPQTNKKQIIALKILNKKHRVFFFMISVAIHMFKGKLH